MIPDVATDQLTAAQALAWLAFRDTSKGEFVDIGDLVPVAVEVTRIPPKRSKAEKRLDAFSRSSRLRKEERHLAYLSAQARRVRRLQAKSRFRIDPATGSPVTEMRARRNPPSALLALATAYAVADGAPRYLEPRKAAGALVAACAAGRVSVTGLAFGAGDRTTINPAWWNEARLCAGAAPYSLVAQGAGGSTTWHDLLFDRAAVERLWPCPAVEIAPPAPIIRKGNRGPKTPYMTFVVKRLRLIQQTRLDIFENASAYELTSAVRANCPPGVRLPKSRAGIEAAINKGRAIIDAADAAVGVSPKFPATTSAAVSI